MGEKVNTLLQAVSRHEATRESGVPQLLEGVPGHIVMIRLPSREEWQHQYRLTLGGLRNQEGWSAHSKALKAVDASKANAFRAGKLTSPATDKQVAQATELERAARLATGRVLGLAAGAYALSSDQDVALREAQGGAGPAMELIGQFKSRLDAVSGDAADGGEPASDHPSFNSIVADIVNSSAPLPNAAVSEAMQTSDAFASAVVERYLYLSVSADRAITEWTQAGAARLGKASGGTEPAVPSEED